MSRGIDIISADISSFDEPFLECQNIFWIGNDVILWQHSLCCDAIIGPNCQHFCNAVNVKVGNHIAM